MRKVMFALLALCGACGGGGGSTSVNGTVGGQSMTARDSISNVIQSGSDSAGVILISNTANSCALITAQKQPKNAQALLIEIGTQTATAASAPSAPGTYPVYSQAASTSVMGNVAIVFYAATDAACATTADYESVSGTVTLTRVDTYGYAGTFDVTFGNGGGHVTGSFTTTVCPALTTSIGGTCT